MRQVLWALISILILSSLPAAQNKPKRSATDVRFEACRSKLKKAKQLDVLYDLSWQLPREPRVLVGPTFFNIPVDAKEGFADTVNCFLAAGASDKCVNFNLLDWRTGNAIARYSSCRLKVN